MKAILVDKTRADGLNYSIQKRIFNEAGIEFEMYDCHSESEVVEKCSDADAMLVIYEKITPKIMDACKNLKVILRYGIGYDCIDVDAATKRGIKVCNSPRHCLDEVATHTIALLLAAERHIIAYNDEVRAGGWKVNIFAKPHRLSTQTLGFIGFGNIARRTADFAKSFGFNMIAYDPYLSEEVIEAKGAKRVELDELLATADVISIHTPLFESTYHLINRNSIAKMKDGVIIVNTSRGPIIALDDLLDALKTDKIQCAALDVIETEPNVAVEKVFANKDKIIITPHAAYNSIEAENQMMEVLANTAVDILKGKTPDNIVNKKALGIIK